MGSFRLTKSTPHLHGEFNFAESMMETVESRDTIHARLQLIDKEFRYLWNLMVRSAVYEAHRLTTF